MLIIVPIYSYIVVVLQLWKKTNDMICYLLPVMSKKPKWANSECRIDVVLQTQKSNHVQFSFDKFYYLLEDEFYILCQSGSRFENIFLDLNRDM